MQRAGSVERFDHAIFKTIHDRISIHVVEGSRGAVEQCFMCLKQSDGNAFTALGGFGPSSCVYKSDRYVPLSTYCYLIVHSFQLCFVLEIIPHHAGGQPSTSFSALFVDE